MFEDTGERHGIEKACAAHTSASVRVGGRCASSFHGDEGEGGGGSGRERQGLSICDFPKKLEEAVEQIPSNGGGCAAAVFSEGGRRWVLKLGCKSLVQNFGCVK